MTTSKYIEFVNWKRELVPENEEKAIRKYYLEVCMTHEAFKKKYIGVGVDFDHGGTFECVDLMRQYCVDVLGLPGYVFPALGRWGGAKDLWNKYDASKFTRVTNVWNDPNCFPPQGAIIVWRGLVPSITGWAGHVGIADQASKTSSKVIVLNQNYPSGSLPNLRTFTYTGMYGWFIKK